MAMHMVRQKSKKQQARGAALPYKQKPESLPVAEDTALAEKMFGNKYEMILIGAVRAYDLYRGAAPMTKRSNHRPTVIATLEAEEGMLTRTYVPKYSMPKKPQNKNR